MRIWTDALQSWGIKGESSKWFGLWSIGGLGSRLVEGSGGWVKSSEMRK
jgi:hypothetical protein